VLSYLRPVFGGPGHRKRCPDQHSDLEPRGIAGCLRVGRCDGLFFGAYRESVQPGELIWSDALAALAYYERVRAGKPARMKFDFSGEVCHLFSMSQWFRTEPGAITGQAEVEYAAHIWVNMLKELGVAENVLVEVPVPGTAPTGWEKVWQALVKARNSFEQGGEWLVPLCRGGASCPRSVE